MRLLREITIIVNSTERKEKRNVPRDTIQLAIVQFRVFRAPNRPEKDFLNFLNEQPRSSTSMCPNTFASNRTMPRSQQLTSIFHQSHTVHGRTRTFFSRSLFALFSSVLFFLAFTKKIMSNFFGAASHSSFRNFASVSLALRLDARKNERSDLFSQ